MHPSKQLARAALSHLRLEATTAGAFLASQGLDELMAARLERSPPVRRPTHVQADSTLASGKTSSPHRPAADSGCVWLAQSHLGASAHELAGCFRHALQRHAGDLLDSIEKYEAGCYLSILQHMPLDQTTISIIIVLERGNCPPSKQGPVGCASPPRKRAVGYCT